MAKAVISLKMKRDQLDMMIALCRKMAETYKAETEQEELEDEHMRLIIIKLEKKKLDGDINNTVSLSMCEAMAFRLFWQRVPTKLPPYEDNMIRTITDNINQGIYDNRVYKN